jgi:hypothetical protein
MSMTLAVRLAAATLSLAALTAALANAQPAPVPAQPPAMAPGPAPAPPPPAARDGFSADELIAAGHRFFGSVSRSLAQVVEKAGSQWGQPNGYILGE